MHSKGALSISVLLMVFTVLSCAKKKAETQSAQGQEAACISNRTKVALVGDGKEAVYLSFAEGVTLLSDSAAKAPAGDSLCRIRLADGKEGNVPCSALAVGGNAAAVIGKTILYRRPDISTITSQNLSEREIVVALKEDQDWVEVQRDHRQGTGWIKAEGLTYAPADMLAARLIAMAMADSDEAVRQQKLNEIAQNPEVSASVFVAGISTTVPMPDMDSIASTVQSDSGSDMTEE